MKNTAALFSRFISENSGLLLGLARKMSNRLITQEDAMQTLYLKILELFDAPGKINSLSYLNQSAYIRSSISNFVTDSIRKSVVHGDSVINTALTRDSIPEPEMCNINEEQYIDHYLSVESDESFVASKLFVEEALKHIQKYEEELPGVSKFFQELVEPSPSFCELYLAYNSELTRPRNSGYIAPSVIGMLLGYSKFESLKREDCIKSVLRSVFGVSKNSICIS